MEEVNISVVPGSSTPGTAENKIEKHSHPVMYISQLLLYIPLPAYTHTHIYMKKYKGSKQSHFKRNTLFLWHIENSNYYTSSVEAFMNAV